MNDRLSGAIRRLRDLMADLRSPGGCPWDAAQTPATLKRYLVEEAYEVLEALDDGDPPWICEELGDLLLQIVFQARIFEERGAFDLADVAEGISAKLIRRHPHVFAGAEARTTEAVEARWEQIKAEEKLAAGAQGSGGIEVPRALPALLRARKVVNAGLRSGGTRPNPGQIVSTIDETLALLRAAPSFAPAALTAVLGKILFSLVQFGNCYEVDAEEALRQEVDRVLAARTLIGP